MKRVVNEWIKKMTPNKYVLNIKNLGTDKQAISNTSDTFKVTDL
jgi:hypothetical protein